MRSKWRHTPAGPTWRLNARQPLPSHIMPDRPPDRDPKALASSCVAESASVRTSVRFRTPDLSSRTSSSGPLRLRTCASTPPCFRAASETPCPPCPTSPRDWPPGLFGPKHNPQSLRAIAVTAAWICGEGQEIRGAARTARAAHGSHWYPETRPPDRRAYLKAKS